MEGKTKYKLLDEYDTDYGTFDTKQQALDYQKTRRVWCIFTGVLIEYRILPVLVDTDSD